MKWKFTYGLDFGTSNTAITAWDWEKRKVISDPAFSAPEPTLLYFPPTRLENIPAVGTAAIRAFVDHRQDGRFFQALKTILPQKSFTQTRVNGEVMTLEFLIATILRFFKDRADRALGERVDSVVMGRPVVFGNGDPEGEKIALARLRTAAQMAGFTNIVFQPEPIAAAFDYERTLAEPEMVLVGDFGGGTSDFTLMRVDPRRESASKTDILGTSGVALAGNAFDSAIMREFILPQLGSRATYREYAGAEKVLSAACYAHAAVCEWDKIHTLRYDRKILELIDQRITRSDAPAAFENLKSLILRNYGYELFGEIEKGKIELSTHPTSSVALTRDGFNVDATLDRDGFNRAIEDHLEAFEDCVDGLINQADVHPDQIDAVFLTGGSSQLWLVRELFESKFGAGKIHAGEFFTSVSRGLAASAPALMTNS